MNVKKFASLSAILLVTGLSLSAKQAEASDVVLKSTFDEVIGQHSSLISNQQTNWRTPPVDDRPRRTRPAGSRAK